MNSNDSNDYSNDSVCKFCGGHLGKPQQCMRLRI